MQYDEIRKLWRAYVKAHGIDKTDEVLRKFGAEDDDGTCALGNIDPSDFEKLAEVLSKGTTESFRSGDARGKAGPKTLEEIQDRAWAKFNSAGKNKRSAE